MARGRSGLLAALALVLSIDYTAHASDDAPDVHVEILDYSQAGANLVVAREELRKIYERAGIRLLMTTTYGPQPPIQDVVQIVVLSGPMSERMRMADRLPQTVMGHAGIAARRVYVFFDRIVENTARENRAVMLGRVMAHELGHVLIGESGHSVDGIMQAHLNLDALLSPPLLAEQAQAIRNRLQSARLSGDDEMRAQLSK
jgi:hypothetical protein